MVLPADGSTLMCYEEVTAGVESGRLLLFVNDLNDQRDQRDDEHTESEKLGPCNHTDHPLFFRIGGKEDYPRKVGEPPTVTGSTEHRITQVFVKNKSRPFDNGRLQTVEKPSFLALPLGELSCASMTEGVYRIFATQIFDIS